MGPPQCPSPPVARVADHMGAPTFFVNGAPQLATTYRWEYKDAPTEYLERLVRAGIRLFFVDIDDEVELAPEEHFANITSRLETLRGLCPDVHAVLSIRYFLTPDWCEKHPGECCCFEDGTADHWMHELREPRYSIASKVWLAEVERITRENIRAVESSESADLVAGYHIRCGHCGEWGFWWDYFDSAEHGIEFSPAMHSAFREWLTGRYGSDERFAEAWCAPSARICQASVPAIAEREELGHGDWRHPNTRRNVADYYEFYSDVIADRMIHLARVVKEETGGERLAGMFYGSLTCGSGPTAHRALGRLLAAREIDFLASPPPYENRGPGDYSPLETVIDSVRASGKVWISEADNRTFLSDARQRAYGGGNAHQSVASILRDFANVLTNNCTNWWYDFARLWYDDDRIERAMRIAQDVSALSYEFPRERVSEIAVIVDERSAFCHSHRTLRTASQVEEGVDRDLSHREIIHELGRIGAPYDIWLLDDLVRGRLPAYSLFLFLTCFRMDYKARAAIKKKMAADGAFAVFAYGQGYCDPDESAPLSADNMSDLMEMGLAERPVPEVLEAQLTPLAASQDWLLGTAGQAFGTWERMITTGFGIGPDGKPFKAGMRSTSPVVAADDPGAEVLAEFTGTAGGAALAAKDRGGWTAVYCGTLAVPSWLIRGLARKAGVHLWADVDEIVYANRHFLAIHSDRGGNRTLRLPRNCSVLDCSSAEVVAEESEELMVAFASPGSDWAGTEIFFLGNNREVARARQFLLSRRSFA